MSINSKYSYCLPLPSAPTELSNRPLSPPAIAGITVAAAVCVAAILVVLFMIVVLARKWLIRKKKATRSVTVGESITPADSMLTSAAYASTETSGSGASPPPTTAIPIQDNSAYRATLDATVVSPPYEELVSPPYVNVERVNTRDENSLNEEEPVSATVGSPQYDYARY